MSAMITTNSVNRSVISGQHIGRGRRAMQMNGRDSGSRFSARGQPGDEGDEHARPPSWRACMERARSQASASKLSMTVDATPR